MPVSANEIDKRKIYIKISSLKHYHYSLGKIDRNENKFHTEFKMGNVDIFSPFGSHLEVPWQFLNIIIMLLYANFP